MVDLNCDLGESFGRYTLGDDEAVMAQVTSVNVACGLHAGDPLVMARTVRLAGRMNVALGAHPGYPDLQGFGRRVMDLPLDEAEAFVIYQLGALEAFARVEGVELRHVKPHGAMYNQASKDDRLALALARAVKRFDPQLILVGLAGSALIRAGQEVGLRVAEEGFPDRAYTPDGQLRPRKEPGALLTDPAEICAQAVRLAQAGMDTLCLHGDEPGAADHAAQVRRTLEAAGIPVKPLVLFIP